ncbi:MAG: c-type cytochrome [Hyphomicrobiaceae bacterium]
MHKCRPDLRNRVRATAGRVLALALLSTAALVTTAAAQGTKPDPAKGQALAQRLCSNCHNVGGPGAPAGRPEVPGFVTIAKRPGQTAEGLAGKIIIPHPEMPTISVTLPEIRDIVAYIQSLKD